MNENPLNEFERDIAPYGPVWRSVRVSGLAVRADGHWLSLGLRVSLSDLAPEPIKVTRIYDWFTYFDGRSRIEDFHRMAEELVCGKYLTISPDSGAEASSSRVYLSRQAMQALAGLDEEAFLQGRAPSTPQVPGWYYTGFRKRGLPPSSFGTDRACCALTANGGRSIELLSYQDEARVDGKLRAAEPAYDGLGGLIGDLLPGFNPRLDSTDLQFQVVAPLPFFLARSGPTKLTARAPATTPSGALGLRVFFGPERLAPSPVLRLRPESAYPSSPGIVEWNTDIPWPKGSATAKACLFFMDQEIDSLEMSRWVAGAGLFAVLDDYFDSGRRKLLEGLGLETRRGAPKLQARQFEAAVARLMNLLRVPLIWYGDWLADEQRSDLGGVAYAEGEKVAVLGECTLSKPQQKFSELRRRAEELAAKLGKEAEVMTVVFTPAPAVQSEVQHAAEHSIALVGRDEFRHLLDLLQHSEDPRNVLEFLRQRGRSTAGLIGWSPQP